MPHLGVLVDAPLRFQAAVHPLDVLLGEEGDLLVAQLRLDVVFDVAAVALEVPGRTVPALYSVSQRSSTGSASCGCPRSVPRPDSVRYSDGAFPSAPFVYEHRRAGRWVYRFSCVPPRYGLPSGHPPLAHHAVTGRSSFCHLVLLFRRMADMLFFLPFEGVEPVCSSSFAMPHASLKPAVKLISLDSTSNVFCASNSRSSFLRSVASMSRRSSTWA